MIRSLTKNTPLPGIVALLIFNWDFTLHLPHVVKYLCFFMFLLFAAGLCYMVKFAFESVITSCLWLKKGSFVIILH